MAQVESIVKGSIERTLRDMLGLDGAKATFLHVGMTAYDRGTHKFHMRMFEIFRAGTPTIERMIVKDLFKRLEIPFLEAANLSYENSIKLALKVAHERVRSRQGA